MTATTQAHYAELARALNQWIQGLISGGNFAAAFALRTELDWLRHEATRS